MCMMTHVYDDNDYECVVTEQRADRRVPEVCAILTKLNHGNFFLFCLMERELNASSKIPKNIIVEKGRIALQKPCLGTSFF